MSERRHPNIVNLDEVQATETAQGGFGSRRSRLAAAAGAVALGCSHFEVAPGKTAFPFHFHTNTEEALYILEGRGTLRLGSDAIEVRAGDYVALRPVPEAPHALANTGDAPLRYLALSSPSAPVTIDVVGYPDSNKIAYAAMGDSLKGLLSSRLLKIVRADQPSLGYYDGEPLAKG